jgi:hypothetical protein
MTTRPLLRGDVIISPNGAPWTVIPGSRLTSVGLRKIKSPGGAIRWITAIEADADGWSRADQDPES